MTDHVGSGEPGARQDRMSEVVDQASELLLYAVEQGKKELGLETSLPILRADSLLRRGDDLSLAEGTELLSAYARLSESMSPVTAATLRASDRRFGHHRWWSKFLLPTPLAEAGYLVANLCIPLVLVLCLIAHAEFTRTFIAVVTERQESLEKVKDESRAAALDEKALTRQRKALQEVGPSRRQTQDILQEGLQKQEGELEIRKTTLIAKEDDLENKISVGYRTLDRLIPFFEGADLRNAIRPIGTFLGGFLLPLLYGFLGTLLFILRAIYVKMLERSFDPSRTGEIPVRILLGTLSGMILQWVYVGEGKQIPGGVTPAVLAFLGGYSVELLFTALDRLIAAIKEIIKPSPPPPPAAPPASPPPSKPQVPAAVGQAASPPSGKITQGVQTPPAGETPPNRPPASPTAKRESDRAPAAAPDKGSNVPDEIEGDAGA